jgi:hypothetical protein
MQSSLPKRAALVLASALILLLASASFAFANIASKTILTTNGLCVNSGDPPTLADGTTPCGAAVYGPNGFTGTITYSAAEIGTTAQADDFMCVHTPAGSQFLSFAGTYTLTISTTSNVVLATSTETVAGGTDCVDGANPVTGTINTFTVPAGGVVSYSIMITDVTAQTCQTLFSSYNSIRNQAYDLLDGSHAAAPSVAPCGPTTQTPEVPFAGLLVLTSALGAAVFVARKQGFRFTGSRGAAA